MCLIDKILYDWRRISMKLETERLILVPLTLEDLKKALISKADMVEHLGIDRDIEELDEQMHDIYKKKVANIEANEDLYLFCTYWQMVLKETNKIVGEIGFKGINKKNQVEVGYGTIEKYRSNGYMSEALDALINWAFTQDSLFIKKITANTLKDNESSKKVLINNYFDIEGEDEKYIHWCIKE